MSGGSFSYICYCHSLGELLEKDLEEIESMCSKLEEDEQHLALAETVGVLHSIKGLMHIMDRPIRQELLDVWKAVEWEQSADISRGQLEEAYGKYERYN